MSTVALRTGREVPDGLVQPVLLSLGLLAEHSPVALYELAMLARDPWHRLFGNTGQLLTELGLVDQAGKLHDATRDVVLATVEGDGLDMCLVSPYAAEGGAA